MADIDEQDLGTRLAAAVRGFREHLINNPQLLAQLAAEEARRKARDRYIDERLARQAATPDGPRRWALPDDRETAKAAIHRPLHDLNVRIVGLAVGDCHCNLIAEVVLDALTDASPAADGQDGDGRG